MINLELAPVILVTVPPPGTKAPTNVTMSSIVHFQVAFLGSVTETSEKSSKSLVVGVALGYVYIIGILCIYYDVCYINCYCSSTRRANISTSN